MCFLKLGKATKSIATNLLTALLLLAPTYVSIKAETNVNTELLNGTVTGKVIEKGNKAPLQFANIGVYSVADSSLISGAISNEQGDFIIKGLPAGVYYLVANFIGYDAFTAESIAIKRDYSKVDIGTILLNNSSLNLNEINVVAQENAIEYHLDKKVLDPAQFPTASGGTAVDILANAPSITVDIEGNVSLRGSENFTVYVDGRPTPFEPSEALEQIPASSIRNIEVITNPSAKFDPDGTAGIININTKKSKMNGLSGILNANTDSRGSVSGDFLLNYKLNKLNFFAGGNRGDRRGKGDFITNNWLVKNDTLVNYNDSDGKGYRNRQSYSVKAGLDYAINDYSNISFTYNRNSRDGKRGSDVRYHEWQTPFGAANDTLSSETNFSNNISNRSGDNNEFTIDFRRTFETEGQELTAMIDYEVGSGEEFTDNLQFIKAIANEGLKSWEIEDQKELRIKIDYVQPTRYNGKIEVGFQSRIDRSEEWNDQSSFDRSTNKGDYDQYLIHKPNKASPEYKLTEFSRDIHAAYGIWSQELGPWGYQLGLRGEYTKRNINYSENDTTSGLERFNIFPTFHTSYSISDKHQVAASYTRRIRRPRGHYFEPFITQTDAYNVRRGNPDIKPEYIDSYELGYNWQLPKNGFFSAEGYFRQVNDKIERVNRVYEEADNVMLRTVENIGTSYAIGIESILNLTPFKWWTTNVMLNMYRFEIDGEAYGESFDTKSNNWSTRWNNSFTLTKSTKLQGNIMYNSPTVTAQGRREGFAFTNFAVRQDFYNRRLSVTLSVRDLFDTAKFEHTSSGSDFSNFRKFDLDSPVYGIAISYRLNNFQPKKREGNGGEDMNGGGDGDF